MNPSYAWRGIWEAKNLLIKGGRWSVGDGLSIHIMKDSWILGFQNLETEIDSRSMLHNGQSALIDGKVASLIDSDTKWWDVSKVRALFNPKIAEEILKLNPSTSNGVDKWIWNHEKSGKFSVKSAYRFFKSCTTQINGGILHYWFTKILLVCSLEAKGSTKS